jgi:drug/metabolite transporter (DMT)-like permease
LAGDRLTGLQILGAALMIGAVVLAEVRSAVVENGRNREESAA